MTFKELIKEISRRSGPAYGAGPAGFKRLLKQLGSPHQAYQIIHVAGTNGKGSVCYLTARMLQAAGHKTGLFISPHLHSPQERISMNGKSISRADFVRLCQQVMAQEKKPLNFFEILTAVAFLYFAEQHAAWVVLETGLGGRKDPTNVCTPAASVITSIGLDHCHILGNRLAQIAHEKAGIIKPQVPVFCPPLAKQAAAVVREIAKQKNAPLRVVRPGNPFQVACLDWPKNKTLLQKNDTQWALHLIGTKQAQNACVVYQVGRCLQVPESAIKKGLAQVQVPGRFEIFRRGRKTIVLDGAHNPQAMAHLMKCWQQSPWAKQGAVVCGFMADKDYPAMLRALAQHGHALYVTTLSNPRAATRSQIRAAMPTGARASYFASPYAALRAALAQHPAVLVTGSFYLVGALRKRLKRAATHAPAPARNARKD